MKITSPLPNKHISTSPARQIQPKTQAIPKVHSNSTNLILRSSLIPGFRSSTAPRLSKSIAASGAAPSDKSVAPAVAEKAQRNPQKQPQDNSGSNKGTSRRSKKMVKDIQASGGIRSQLTGLFRQSLQTAFPGVEDRPFVAPCNNPTFGDYQCNNAMQLFGKLKGKEGAPKAPRDVANALLKSLPPNDIVSDLSLAGPGFINIRVSPKFLSQRVSAILTSGLQQFAPDLSAKRSVVDFSSPNVAKEMHVGHLRSTIIGDTICRVLELCGSRTLRLNHIGDWGTQFGMLIQHMTETSPTDVESKGVSDLMQLYRAAKKRFDDEEDFKMRSREAVTSLQSGDPKALQMWEQICAASRAEFSAIYERLGVQLEERGESFYNPMLKGVVEELKEKGVAELSDGAMCVFVEGQKIPLIVQKSDGGFGYASTDMAALKHRIEQEKADWIVYVTDGGQGQHFELVFGAAKKAGWIGAPGAKSPEIDHVGFGLVLGEDGKKFKTRSGDTVRLVELLDEAKSRCTATIKTRWEEAGEQIEESYLDQASNAMGYGAVKYADLKSHRLTNYKFSFDAMLDLKGNTAVYLLYAHARIAQIIKKSGKDVDELAKSTHVTLEHPKELALALHLARFSEALEDMLEELAPNRLTDYLYELSEHFNALYVECKVIGSENEASRLLLCEATARVMRQLFSLLGITPLYRI